MKPAIVLSARTATIVLLTLPLSGCASQLQDFLTLLNPFGGRSETTVVVCPEYPVTPPEVVDVLEREARASEPFEQWVIDQSQLRDNLRSC